MLDRPPDGGPNVPDLTVDDRQPFVLITTRQLGCGAFDKITIVLGVTPMGGHSIRVQRAIAARVLPDQLQQPEARLGAALVLTPHQRLRTPRGQAVDDLDLAPPGS